MSQKRSKNSSTKPLLRTRRRPDISELNVIESSSTSLKDVVQKTDICKKVTSQHIREIANEIIDKATSKSRGRMVSVSSSSCSSRYNQPSLRSESSWDRRLKYHHDMLEERRQIAKYLSRKTRKLPKELLQNKDTRDKDMMKCVIDYADRMNPTALSTRVPAVMKSYVDSCSCKVVEELRETLPKAERDKFKIVEISGVPIVTKEAQLGVGNVPNDENSNWLHSKVLEQRIEDKREDIEQVIEHYPDISNLEVVAHSYAKMHSLDLKPNMERVCEDPFKSISSDTTPCENYSKVDEELALLPEYAVKINGLDFQLPYKSSSKVKVEPLFECEPFETTVKQVLQLENVGRKALSFKWLEPTAELCMMKSNDGEFDFNTAPFRLVSGEIRKVLVQFQPRKVRKVRDEWLLKISPQFFCHAPDSVVIILTGLCIPSPEYIDKLDEAQLDVVEKFNWEMVNKLNTTIPSLTPLLQPFEATCPYQRELNEYEFFEIENPGLSCERMHNLELLKDIYKRVKKPREPAWDLKLSTLQDMILRRDGAGDRASMFSEFMNVIDSMRGNPIELEQKLDNDPDYPLVRFMLVKGVLRTSIDEWEELVLKIGDSIKISMNVEDLKGQTSSPKKDQDNADLEEDLDHVGQIDDLSLTDPKEDSEHRNSKKDSAKTISPKNRLTKLHRDALYLSTYNHLCQMAENIVNAVESSDGI